MGKTRVIEIVTDKPNEETLGCGGIVVLAIIIAVICAHCSSSRDKERQEKAIAERSYEEELERGKKAAEEQLDRTIKGNSEKEKSEILRLEEKYAQYREEQVKKISEFEYQRAKRENQMKKERELIVCVTKEEKEKQRQQSDIQYFALKEAPVVWKIRAQLRAEEESLEKRRTQMKNMILESGKDPEQDRLYLQLLCARNQALRSLRQIDMKLKDAFVASRKLALSPSKKELEELKKKSLEEGVREAEMVEARFRFMHEIKKTPVHE